SVLEHRARSSSAIEITSRLTVECTVIIRAGAVKIIFGEFLTDAHRLKIHSENCGYTGSRSSIVFQAVNLVKNRVDFELIIFDCAHHADGGIESIHVRNLR